MPKALTKEEFIIKSTNVHGNKFDYSKVIYKNNQTKIEIICPIHNSFYLTPGKHLQGRGCQICSGSQLNKIEFIVRANKKHSNKYDYSKTEYFGIFNKIKIICPEHGEFEQTPDRHINSNGCLKCGTKKSTINRTYTTLEFINKAKEVHGNKYDYSNSFYIKGKIPISIICPKHGEFKQTPSSHFSGKGCIKCCESKGEREISNILLSLKIKFESQKKFATCKNITYLPFDFYLPEQNICIEFDGDQHYKPIKWFGGLSGLKERQKNDKIKETFCKNNSIKLIRIKNGQNIYEKLNKLFHRSVAS